MKTVKEALAQVCADFDDLNIFDNSKQNEKPEKNLVDLSGRKAWLYHTVGGQGPVSVGTIKRYI